MKNLISVLLGSNEIFSLICFSFQNLTLLRTLPHFYHILSTCVFMDFTLPTLIFFFRKKTNPAQTPVFLILPFQITRISASFFFSSLVTFPKLKKFGPVPARKGKVIRQSLPTILLLHSRTGTTNGKEMGEEAREIK